MTSIGALVAALVDRMDVGRRDAATVCDAVKSMKMLIGNEPQVYQEIFLNSQDDILEKSVAFIETFDSGTSDLKEVDLRGLWQFLHNLCVKQVNFCDKLWQRLKVDLVRLLLSDRTEGRTKNVAAAVALQVVVNKRSFDGEDDHVVGLLTGLLQSIMNDERAEHDFPLLCAKKLLLEREVVLLSYYRRLNRKERCLVLDIVTEEISEQLPEQAVRFASTEFQSIAKVVLTVLMKKQRAADPSELMKLLNILCCTSHLERFRRLLQNDKSLLIDAIYLLRMVHDAGKEDKTGMFATVSKLGELADAEKMESDPVFGFKRDLVRLVGNLSSEHRENQDEVRENHGIELILDCSPIDGKNPFITQWVIFAIRNICLGNPENQALLYSINKTGTVDENLMSNIGIEIKKL